MDDRAVSRISEAGETFVVRINESSNSSAMLERIE